MADYDLGTASGRIEIENDRKASEEVRQALRDIKKSVQDLQKTLEQTGHAVDEHNKKLNEVKKTTKTSTSAQRSHNREMVSFAAALRLALGPLRAMGRTMKSVSLAAKNLAVDVKGMVGALNLSSRAMKALGLEGKQLSDILFQVGKNAFLAQSIIKGLGDTMRSFAVGYIKNVGGALKNYTIARTLGIENGFKLLPDFVKKLNTTGAALIGVNAAAKKMAKSKYIALALGAIGTTVIPSLVSAGNNIGSFQRRIVVLSRFLGSRGVPGMSAFSGAIQRMGNDVRKGSGALGTLGRDIGKVYPNAVRMAKGLTIFTTGLAISANAVRGFRKMITTLIVGMESMILAFGALKGLGSIILGIANALKQMSGALLILPGVLATLGIAGGVAVIGFKNLGKAFKAAGKDGQEFEDAIKDMSPTMKGLARAAKDIREPTKKLGEMATERMFAGLDKDFKNLSKGYMPVLDTGVRRVADSLKAVKDGFVSFLSKPETIRDINHLFAVTAKTMHNLAPAITPFLSALKDIAVVGAEAFLGLTTGAQGAAQRFADFTAEARKTGELRKKIDDGITGFRQFGQVITGTGRLVATFFKAFGSSGDNALSRSVAALDRWNTSLKNSAQGGALDIFAKKMQSLSDLGVKSLSIAWDGVINAIKTAQGFLDDFSAGFAGGLVDSIKTVDIALQAVAQTLKFLQPAAGIIGALVAFGAFGKILRIVLSPLKRMALLLVGVGTAAFGAARFIYALVKSLVLAKASSGLMATALGKMRISALGFASAMAGAVVVGIAAAIAIFAIWSSKREQAASAEKAYQESVTKTSEAQKSLNEELQKTGGIETADTYAKMGDVIEAMGEQMDAASQKKATLGQGDWFPGQHSTADKIKEYASLMGDAKNNIDKLGLSSEELGRRITGSSAAFGQVRSDLIGMGRGGETAANELQKLRDSYLSSKAAAESIGPANAAVAQGIKLVADGASDAEQKLQGLKLVLQGLGLIQTSAEQAGFEYQKQLVAMADAAVQAADDTKPLGQALIDNNGHLKETEPNAQRLNDKLSELGDGFLAAAVAGKDPNQLFRDMQPVLKALGDEFDLGVPKIQELAGRLGVLPKQVEIIMSLKGADQIKQDVATVAEAATRASGKPFSVPVDPGSLAKLQELGVTLQSFDKDHNVATVTMDPTQAQRTLDSFRTLLKDDPVKAPVTPGIDPKGGQQVKDAYGKPITVPVKVGVDPNYDPKSIATRPDGSVDIEAQKKKFQKNDTPSGGPSLLDRFNVDQLPDKQNQKKDKPKAPQQQAPQAPNVPEPAKVGEAPKDVKTNIEASNTDAAIGAVEQFKRTLDSLPPQKTVNVVASGTDAAIGAVEQLARTLNSLGGRKGINVVADGTDAAIGAVMQLQRVLDALPLRKAVDVVASNTDSAIGAVEAFRRAIDGIQQSVDASVQGWRGYLVSISQAMQAAIAAVNGMSSTVKVVLDNTASNAKNSGMALGQGFADGILSKAKAVQEASMKLAQAAARPLPSSPAKIGPFSGTGWTPYRGAALAAGFAKGIKDNKQQAVDASLHLASGVSLAMDAIRATFNVTPTYFDANDLSKKNKYYRDPEITDQQLVENRTKKAKEEEDNAAEQAAKDAYKAGKNTPKAQQALAKATESRQKAEERVAKAQETAGKAKNKEDSNKAVAEAQKSLSEAKDREAKAKKSLEETKATAASNGTGEIGSAAGASGSVDKFVTSMDNAQYQMGAFSRAMVDCTGFVAGAVNTGEGLLDPFTGPRTSTPDLGNYLKQRGYVEGKGGPGDLSVAWWDGGTGGGSNGHAAITTPSGRNAESTTGGVRYGDQAAGARSNNSQFTNFMYKPMKEALDDSAAENTPKAPPVDPTSTSLTSQQVTDLIVAEGKKQGLSDEEIASGVATGIVESNLQNLPGGDRDSVGAFQQRNFAPWTSNGRNRMNVTDAAASYFDQLKGTSGTPGDRAQAVQRSAFPEKYAQQMTKAQELTAQSLDRLGTSGGVVGDGSSVSATDDDMLKEARASNKKLDEAITIAQSPTASDPEVIQALQSIDEQTASTPGLKSEIESIKSGVMEDRGIKLYDPKEGASTDPLSDGIAIAQNVVGLVDQLTQGFDGFKQLTELLVRGLSSTKDVGTAIDGVQSVINSVVQVVSTVVDVASTVASLAALAGAAIPGVGQVAAIASTITGGIANVNAIVDLMQEVSHIIGRGIGSLLSGLFGGADGPLMGDVKNLLDTNDMTLKSWSSDNPMDKRTMNLDPWNRVPDKEVGGQGSNQFNIYANPNASANEIINETMYAVKVNGQGAFAYS